MRPNRKNSVAAIWLALPAAAALLLSPPVAAQHARIALHGPGGFPAAVHEPAIALPDIERFVVRADGPLRPGTELRFRLRGTPGARAWVHVPGEVRGLPLAEVRAGVYAGSHTIRHGGRTGAHEVAFAVLRSGDRQVTARAEVDDRAARDHQPPQISDVTPDHGDRIRDDGRVRIAARYRDDRSGVDPASVRLRIDGRDVTHRARVGDDAIRYRDDLPRGRHTAELLVRDHAGNTARTAWTFVVVDGHHRDGRWDRHRDGGHGDDRGGPGRWDRRDH